MFFPFFCHRDLVCPNGEYQENFDYAVCSTWFDINKCDDSTCDTTASGTQTRCNLNTEAQTVLTSSGQICEEGYSPGAPFRLHQTNTYLDAWQICPWCCNWCNETATISKHNLVYGNAHK